MRDIVWSYGVLVALVTLLVTYGIRIVLRGRARNSRVDKDGGSLFVAKGFMEFGYWLMEPIASALVRLRVTPNQITWGALIPAVAAGIAVADGRFGLACLLSTVASLGDTLDGIVARRVGTASDAGEAFDAAADRYVEFFFIGGLVLHYRQSLLLCVLSLMTLMGAFLISYSTAKAEALRVPPPRGLMRRAERAIYLSVAAGLTPFVSALFPNVESPWIHEAPMVLAVVLVGVVANASAISRLSQIMKSIRVRDAKADVEADVESEPKAQVVALSIERTSAQPASPQATPAIPRA